MSPDLIRLVVPELNRAAALDVEPRRPCFGGQGGVHRCALWPPPGRR
ncbi:MAG: hypothetical protein ACOY40_12155 [Bacillota bacterium]